VKDGAVDEGASKATLDDADRIKLRAAAMPAWRLIPWYIGEKFLIAISWRFHLRAARWS